jgi:replicative DNA helicase
MQNQNQIEFYEFTQKNEKNVLGAILVRNRLMRHALGQKMFTSFLDSRHRLIFAAMSDLFNRKEEITVERLIRELNTNGLLDNIGGESYVTSILSDAPSILSGKNQDYVQRFMIISIAMSLQSVALSDKSLKDLNAVLENKVKQLSNILPS